MSDAQDMIRARNLLGMTQEELGDELGWVGGRQVSQIERGRARMQGQTRLAIERLLIKKRKWSAYKNQDKYDV